ncbi:MAG: hypothetical protein U0V64_05635 [Cyclobacteriaceae bacterium]
MVIDTSNLPDSLKFIYSHLDVRTDFTGYSGVVITDVDEVDQIRYIVRKIRSNNDEKISLLPIILHTSLKTLPSSLENMVDLLISDLVSQGMQVADVVAGIQTAIQRMAPIQKATRYEDHVLTRALRFVYTRNRKTLNPAINDDGPVGYVHSFLTQFMDREYSLDQYDMLKLALREGLFTSEFVDVIYLCNKCHSGALMYREACPNCQSTHLVHEDIIHHFPCAYVGPQQDFVIAGQEQDLICPKCDKRLKHIGVDYDKPSSIFTCQKCDQRSQHPVVVAKCCSCLHDNPVEHLIKRDVFKYHITAKAVHNAVQGTIFSMDNYINIPGTLPKDVFQVLIRQEVERMKVAKIESHMAAIELVNLVDLFNRIGPDAQTTLLTELINVIREGLKSVDIISIENSSIILLGLLERKHDEAINIISNLIVELKRLVRDNYKGFEVQINFNLNKLATHRDAAEQYRSLLEEKTKA